MKGLILTFWILFWLFVYKLSFLQRDSVTTGHKFSIIRDADGVPHIYATTYKDLLFGLGYAQGQDRLFALYIKKMFVQGRLSEVFGKELVLSDLEMRNIGFMEMGKNNKLHTDPQTLELVQAYADGINQYAKTTKMLPFQFYLLWKDWDNWLVENTLAQINLLSFMLQFDWFYEIARQRLLQTIGFDIGIKAMSYGGKNLFRNTTIVKDDELKKLGKYKQYDFDHQMQVLKDHWKSNNVSLGSIHFPPHQFKIQGTGSNSWVIGGQHTEHGKPILANDPHVGSMIPGLFYAIQLVILDEKKAVKSRKFGVIPDGVPSIPLGVSPQVAWGTTAAYIDNKDVYFQTIRNISGKMQYLFKDEWLDFTQRKELIKVRGEQDIEQIFYHTHRGVVLEQIFMDIHWKYGFPLPQKYSKNHTLTLVASHFRIDNASAKGHMKTITFQSVEEFLQAGNTIINPNTDSSFIFANGTYGYRGVGGITKRKIPEMGSFIKNGNTDIYDMGQYLKPEETLVLVNPQRGYLAMGNNRFVSDHFEFRSSLHQIVTGRAFRLQKIITEKISKKQKFTFEDMKTMQLDQRDEFVCQVLLPLLGKLTHLRQIWSNPQTEVFLSRLQRWDCVMGKDSIQAAIYSVWQHLFQQSFFKLADLNQDQVQAIVNHAFFQNYQFVLFEKIIKNQLLDEQRTICQSLQTRKHARFHPCQASIALAFKRLPQELKKLFGSDDIEDYKWGTIHNQQFKIVPFGQIPLLRNFWQRNFPVGGNSRTLHVSILTSQSKTYNSIASPAFRFISDINRTSFSIQVGQSDRIFSSPFYDNFVGQNRYVEYVHRNPYLQGAPTGWKQSIDTLN